MQTIKGLSKKERVKLEAKRYANMLFVYVTIMYMFYVLICIPVNIVPDVAKLLIVPRIEDHMLLKWMMAAYLALALCVEWYLFQVVQRARARIKGYAVTLEKNTQSVIV